MVVEDCYCWVAYVKPWHYWNHWDYYAWGYYWDYNCGCWVYAYQPWYHWYYPSTIYYNLYGYCHHYYQVTYVKVYEWWHQYLPVFFDKDKQTATATKKSTI